MAARNKPAGIRSLVYETSKGKGGIEGLSVSGGQGEVVNRFEQTLPFSKAGGRV